MKRALAEDDGARASIRTLPLAGRSILVTGGGGGIGRACCVLFASRGAAVVAADLDAEAAHETVRVVLAELPKARISACKVDVTNSESVEAMVKHAVDTNGHLDGAVNAAGIEGERALLHETDISNYDKVMCVNLKGTFLCMRAIVKQMLKQSAHTSSQRSASAAVNLDTCNYAIVNVSSTAGQSAMPEFSCYSASKFAIVGLTRTAAKEYAPQGIRVNAIAPSTTDTPMVARFTERWPEWQAKQNASFPVGRIGRTDEVAATCAFLLSAECPMLTGAVLTIDGALSA